MIDNHYKGSLITLFNIPTLTMIDEYYTDVGSYSLEEFEIIYKNIFDTVFNPLNVDLDLLKPKLGKG